MATHSISQCSVQSLAAIVLAIIINLAEVELTCDLDENFALNIICRNISATDVGPAFDVVVGPILAYEDFVNLELSFIEFSNGRVQPNWYNGKIEIYFLRFQLDNVLVIEDNAFNAPALLLLNGMELILNTFTEFKSGMFMGLNDLEMLVIRGDRYGAYMCNLNDQWLRPIQRKLNWFNHYRLNNSLQDFFGTQKLTRLYNISVSNPPFVFHPRILGQNDFTGLRAVISLVLMRCNIYAILEKTFDTIGETLAELDLNFNEIAHASIDMFYKYLDSPIMFEIYHKVFLLTSRQLHCDCDFYLLKNASVISFGEWMPLTCLNYSNIPSDGACDPIQIIHIDRFGLLFPYGLDNKYAYVNFQLKLGRDPHNILIVTQFKRRPYRLLTYSFDDAKSLGKIKCPKADHDKCFIFSSTEVRIPTPMKTTFTFFCVIFLQHPQRVWPLHCQTLFNPSHNANLEDWTSMVLWGSSVIIVLSFCIGFFSYCIWKVRDHQIENNADSKSTYTYESGNNLSIQLYDAHSISDDPRTRYIGEQFQVTTSVRGELDEYTHYEDITYGSRYTSIDHDRNCQPTEMQAV